MTSLNNFLENPKGTLTLTVKKKTTKFNRCGKAAVLPARRKVKLNLSGRSTNEVLVVTTTFKEVGETISVTQFGVRFKS